MHMLETRQATAGSIFMTRQGYEALSDCNRLWIDLHMPQYGALFWGESVVNSILSEQLFTVWKHQRLSWPRASGKRPMSKWNLPISSLKHVGFLTYFVV